ncbi:MAG: SDR family oxidoreductase [Bacilli bacterium]|nr:SDR family oxidoreductase [Bacilli bacterium]
MKTVVITGSARGLGLEMAKCFRSKNFNVIISDLFKKDLENARKVLLKVKGQGDIDYFACDITKENDIVNLINKVKNKYGVIDFWINNAGINQPDKMIWDLSSEEIDRMLDIDLKGTIVASKLISKVMIEQNKGSIYNVEGHGSNDAIIPGLSIYGTAKRGVTYFTMALAKEMENMKVDVIVGRLSPGIMITDFIVNAFRNKKIELSNKNKKVYNILGDYPDIVAKYLVNKMIINTNNNVKINWLTNRKAAFRFMTSMFNKRDFFKDK